MCKLRCFQGQAQFRSCECGKHRNSPLLTEVLNRAAHDRAAAARRDLVTCFRRGKSSERAADQNSVPHSCRGLRPKPPSFTDSNNRSRLQSLKAGRSLTFEQVSQESSSNLSRKVAVCAGGSVRVRCAMRCRKVVRNIHDNACGAGLPTSHRSAASLNAWLRPQARHVGFRVHWQTCVIVFVVLLGQHSCPHEDKANVSFGLPQMRLATGVAGAPLEAVQTIEFLMFTSSREARNSLHVLDRFICHRCRANEITTTWSK